MTRYDELRAGADSIWQSYTHPPRPQIAVNASTDGHARGADATHREIERAVAERGLEIDLGITGSIGVSYLEPTVVVTKQDGCRVLYGPVTPDRVASSKDVSSGPRAIPSPPK